jgi:hypothetical protein
MKISCSRIGALLKRHGFVTRYTSAPAKSCAYVRDDQKKPLFQHIDVSFAGNHKEAVVAHVTASTTKWMRVKGLSVSRLLDEIATDLDRGWSVVTTEDEAKEWEKSLAHIGPSKVSELATDEGGSLLERTREARQIAEVLLARLDREGNVSDQLAMLEHATPLGLVTEAQRLASWPGVMQVSGCENVYILACLSVLNGDSDSTLLGKDPLESDELMWQIQLVADGILSRHVHQTR